MFNIDSDCKNFDCILFKAGHSVRSGITYSNKDLETILTLLWKLKDKSGCLSVYFTPVKKVENTKIPEDKYMVGILNEIHGSSAGSTYSIYENICAKGVLYDNERSNFLKNQISSEIILLLRVVPIAECEIIKDFGDYTKPPTRKLKITDYQFHYLDIAIDV